MELFEATIAGDVPEMRRLLDGGSPVDWQHPVTGDTALLAATARCLHEPVKLLLSRGADAQLRVDGSSALDKMVFSLDWSFFHTLVAALSLHARLALKARFYANFFAAWLAARLLSWDTSHRLDLPHASEHDGPTLLFCMGDEFGHYKNGTLVAQRALELGYGVDFLCSEGMRERLPAGVNCVEVGGGIQPYTSFLWRGAERVGRPQQDLTGTPSSPIGPG